MATSLEENIQWLMNNPNNYLCLNGSELFDTIAKLLKLLDINFGWYTDSNHKYYICIYGVYP